MSDVTRYNFDTTACWYEHPDGEFVEHDAYAKLAAEAQALREEVAKLTQYNKSLNEENTRLLVDCEETDKEVVVLRTKLAMAEDAAAKGDAARQQCGGMEMEIQELREQAAKLAAFAQEIISGALEGGSFDGADLQESAERHGLIAKQVMREPCRGPEEYCACAWSTSFPTECYRITAELRPLLNQDKENGNG
ncbi:Uncharacterised protein [Pseudomonas aeruginosa]|uniref:hypothetical protein n=1 Tax=Pseudomonas aeruginosa TaxID=287 RepID=UPI0010B05B5E|nr:hypothetical protein [Pseudomonas aeruginosa]VFT04258.1 Uncharacterised protein [Pseudomonas aeruginosa]